MHWLNPDQLPHVTAHVERFLINVGGEIDGMILTTGLEVHSPPHLSDEICASIQPGDHITVWGVRPRSTEMMTAIAFETADHKRILDNGPAESRKSNAKGKQARRPTPASMRAQGTIARLLHGPRGESRGVLLEDGVSIRFPPHEAQRLALLLSPGMRLAVRGKGVRTPLGTSIEAHEMGTSDDKFQAIRPKKPKHDKHHRHDKHAKPGRSSEAP